MKSYRLNLASMGLVGLVSLSALADTKDQIMASKYSRYGFCMEKTYGQPWNTKSKLETVMNRWGQQEPTISEIAAASKSVRQRDKECRLANGIEDEPRPQ